MIVPIGPRHSSGARDSRAPLEWRGPMIRRAGGGKGWFFSTGEGVRAEWQEAPKMPVCLQRNAAIMLGSRWQSASLLHRLAKREQAAVNGAEGRAGLELDGVAERRVVEPP